MSYAKKLIEQSNQLFDKRSGLLSLWQTMADNFYPERADFTQTHNLGDEFGVNLMTSYPVLARRDLGNAIGSMLRPSSKGGAVRVDRGVPALVDLRAAAADSGALVRARLSGVQHRGERHAPRTRQSRRPRRRRAGRAGLHGGRRAGLFRAGTEGTDGAARAMMGTRSAPGCTANDGVDRGQGTRRSRRFLDQSQGLA